MQGLDTNVLIRALVEGDDPDQTRRARDHLKANCTAEQPAYVDAIVLCEAAWVLGGPFGYDRTAILLFLERLLNQRVIRVEAHDLAMAAVELCRTSGMDFADAFIGLRNKRAGADPTITFDRKAAARSPLFRAL